MEKNNSYQLSIIYCWPFIRVFLLTPFISRRGPLCSNTHLKPGNMMRKVFYDLVQGEKSTWSSSILLVVILYELISQFVFIPKSPCLCSCSCLCCYVLVLVVVIGVMESFLHTSERLMKNSLKLTGFKTAGLQFLRLKGAMGNQLFWVEGYGGGLGKMFVINPQQANNL